MSLVVHVCNRYTRLVWVVLASATVVSEVMPVPPMRPLLHYWVYSPAKLACFLLVGYLAPLAFARFNALNRGIAFAAVSAAAVEILQAIIGNGHSFHVYELIVKWVIIAFGFMFGLDARCEGSQDLGLIHLRLIPDGSKPGSTI